MMKISETAPIVQKPVFCMTAPSTKVIANVAQSTDLLKELISTTSMVAIFKKIKV
jgi:hypothetical protein